MTSSFKHQESKRKAFNSDLKGIASADISTVGNFNWRVGPQQYGIQTASRLLKKDRGTLLKIIKELGIKTYWYGSRHVIKPRDMARLKIYLER